MNYELPLPVVRMSEPHDIKQNHRLARHVLDTTSRGAPIYKSQVIL